MHEAAWWGAHCVNSDCLLYDFVHDLHYLALMDSMVVTTSCMVQPPASATLQAVLDRLVLRHNLLL